MNKTRRRVILTEHAKQRLKERVGSYRGYRDWQELAQCVRYSGKAEHEFSDEESLWVKQRIRGLYKSSQIRMLNGFAFLFSGNKGHARTLVTVIKIEI